MYQYLSAQVAREFEEATRTEDLVLDTEVRLRQWHLQSQNDAMARLRSNPRYRKAEAAKDLERKRQARTDPNRRRAEVDRDRERRHAAGVQRPRETTAREPHVQRVQLANPALRGLDAATLEELRVILAHVRCGIFLGRQGAFATAARNTAE